MADSKQKSGQQEEFKDIFDQIRDHQAKQVREEDKTVTRSANFIFVGPRNSGKSTLLNLGLGKEGEAPKPTNALDYMYTRTSIKSMSDASLSNFWELGGGRSLVKLLDLAITPERLADTIIFVVLDLTRTSKVVDDAFYWVELIRSRIDAALTKLKSTNLKLHDQIVQNADDLYKAHADRQSVRVSRVPLVLVASKYEEFKDSKDISPELMKIMSKALRSIAHANGASLVYTACSSKMKANNGQFSEFVKRFILNKPVQPLAQVDHANPIVVTAGADSLEKIGDIPGRGSTPIAQAWGGVCRKTFASFPPQGSDKEEVGALEQLELEGEQEVDKALKQKEEELLKVRRQAQFHRRMKQTEEEFAQG